MLPLLRLFWPICRLRRGPQDLPVSPTLLVLSLGMCLLTGLLSFSATHPPADAALRALVAIAISLGVWTLLMRLLVAPARRLQTLTAIYGCAAILNLLLLPLVLLSPKPEATPAAFQLLIFALLVWGQLINGHILRHALEWPLIAGVAVALAVFIVRYGSFGALFN